MKTIRKRFFTVVIIPLVLLSFGSQAQTDSYPTVTGQGTENCIPMWTGTTTPTSILTDSPIFSKGSYIGINNQNPVELFQIGNLLTFHDGGTKVIGYNFDYDNGDKRIIDGYSTSLRFGPTGDFSIWTSEEWNYSGTDISWNYPFKVFQNGNISVGSIYPSQSNFHIYVPEPDISYSDFAFSISAKCDECAPEEVYYPLYVGGVDYNVGIGMIGGEGYVHNDVTRNKLHVAGNIICYDPSTSGKMLFIPPKNGIARISVSWDCNILEFKAGNEYLDIQVKNIIAESLNVQNNFQVSSDGNVTTSGNISSDGDIIISGNISSQGYSIPSYFEVTEEGKVWAQEVRVKLSNPWADHVFDNDYNLPSLQDVELFIKANKHLIGVPSKDEISKDGLDVCEMDAILLQKIEELTLYIIQQQKEINALSDKLESYK